jgi:hypothetical protein
MAKTDGTYPPLDVPKPVAEGIWVVDSGPHGVFGMALPVRMTVVRLANGDLWLHSPTRRTDDLQRQLEAHGPIRHLVAPDIAHWSYLQEWQRHCPEALVWAAPGLAERRQVKKAGLAIHRTLSDEAPAEWAAELDQLVVRGQGFSEVDFLHRPTRTLVMTDLVQNLETEALPLLTRIMARLNGAAAPHGRAPLYLRWAVKSKGREAAEAAARLVAWEPERVIFSHGRWFDRDGTEQLRRSLDWLLPG